MFVGVARLLYDIEYELNGRDHNENVEVMSEHYRGAWDNVGTPAQLAALDRRIGS